MEFSAELLKHLSGHTLTLTDEAEENVLSADVVVTQLQSFSQRQLEDLFSRGVNGMCPVGA